MPRVAIYFSQTVTHRLYEFDLMRGVLAGIVARALCIKGHEDTECTPESIAVLADNNPRSRITTDVHVVVTAQDCPARRERIDRIPRWISEAVAEYVPTGCTFAVDVCLVPMGYKTGVGTKAAIHRALAAPVETSPPLLG